MLYRSLTRPSSNCASDAAKCLLDDGQNAGTGRVDIGHNAEIARSLIILTF